MPDCNGSLTVVFGESKLLMLAGHFSLCKHMRLRCLRGWTACRTALPCPAMCCDPARYFLMSAVSTCSQCCPACLTHHCLQSLMNPACCAGSTALLWKDNSCSSSAVQHTPKHGIESGVSAGCTESYQPSPTAVWHDLCCCQAGQSVTASSIQHHYHFLKQGTASVHSCSATCDKGRAVDIPFAGRLYCYLTFTWDAQIYSPSA